MSMAKRFWTNLVQLGFMVPAVLLVTEARGRAEDSELDTAIYAGFGKLIKYGRWTAALMLAIVFCLAWAERGQNPDNPHDVNRANKKMIWTGAGFIAVIGYKLILMGLVRWFNVDPATIPQFLWQ